MPKVMGRVHQVGMKDGRKVTLIECNGDGPKKGEQVSLKWGSKRTLTQNALYWKFLTWLIDHGGLKDHGHFDPQALHDNLKVHFLAEKVMEKGQFVAVEEATTTDLGKAEFSEYVEKVNQFMQEFFGIDTAPFWEQYGEYRQ